MPTLPPELWAHVMMQGVSPRDRAACASVCKMFQAIQWQSDGLEMSLRRLLCTGAMFAQTVSFEEIYRSAYKRHTTRNGRKAISIMLRRILRDVRPVLFALRGTELVLPPPRCPRRQRRLLSGSADPRLSIVSGTPHEWKAIAYRLYLVRDILLYREIILMREKSQESEESVESFRSMAREILGLPDAALPAPLPGVPPRGAP